MQNPIARLAADRRGQGGADSAVSLVVAIMVGALLSAYLLPLAINEIIAVDTASWSNGAGELWGILPVMIVLAIFLFFVQEAVAQA